MTTTLIGEWMTRHSRVLRMSESLVVVLWCLLAFAAIGNAADVGLNKTCVDDSKARLRVGYYNESCPTAELIVSTWVHKAVSDDPRMAASLLRLHFHDCFVNGCDGSVLLEDTVEFLGEKTAPPNLNSIRGFELIDDIKSELELTCPVTVSCADILALAARDSVSLSSGPRWEVPLGRKDSMFASYQTSVNHLPRPDFNVEALVSSFRAVGLTVADLVALSGGHTIGRARCSSFSSRLRSSLSELMTDPEFLYTLRQLCYQKQVTTMADLDLMTHSRFDNQYYINLLNGEGLLVSDQVLMTNDETRAFVEMYAADNDVFFEDFKVAMVRMGSLSKLQAGEVRAKCRYINNVI